MGTLLLKEMCAISEMSGMGIVYGCWIAHISTCYVGKWCKLFLRKNLRKSIAFVKTASALEKDFIIYSSLDKIAHLR